MIEYNYWNKNIKKNSLNFELVIDIDIIGELEKIDLRNLIRVYKRDINKWKV